MSEMKPFSVSVTMRPESPLKQIILHGAVMETGFAAQGLMYWIRTDEGKTYRYPVDQITSIIEDRS